MNVHKLRMDTSGNVEDISFVLAKKNGDKLGNIVNVDNIVAKHSMKEASDITFAAHKKMNDNIIKCWNDIKDFKLVWIPEWDMWYEITVEVNEEDENIKNISGKTLGEAELSQIMLYGIEINTETDIAREDYKIPTTFYNPDHPEASLMDRLLTDKAPHYKVKHIDKSLMNLQRTFTFDDTSIYDALQEVSEELDCLFIFGCGSDENGKPERTISVYDLEANCVDCGHRDTFVHKCPKCGSTNIILGYGEYTNVFISRDNLADEITYSVDTDSVKNCMKLEAGDDLMTAAIRSCNPNGTDYIYYFPDETREEMSPELQEKLKSYDALYEKYQSDYNFTINDSFVTNYNALVNKYKTYEEDLKDTEIKNPIVGYPKLMRIYFDTIDMVQLLRNKLMPPVDKPDNNAKSQGEYLMANLPSSASTTSLKNLSVSTADNIMVMLAQSIVKGVFKVTVTNTTLSNNVWKGKFNLENYTDKDDKFTSQFVSISINENYESYVKQRIDSILARSDENYYDIVGLFKQDMTVFKSQLKKYCLNTLQIFQKCCQSCIDMMVQQGISSNSTSSMYGINTKVLYENVYIPYYNKMNAIQDEIKVREDELYTVEGKYNNQNQLVQDGIQIEIERIITEVQDALNFKNYIGIDLYKEFSSFIRMDKFSNDNYISDGLNNTDLMKNAIEFITVATKELFKSATLQHSITGTIKNFLRMKEFEPVTNNFKNGNWICVGIDDKVYQLRIIEYEIDFSDTQNISVTFSDIIKLPDGMSYYERLEEVASKMATSYNGVVRQSTINTNFKNKMNEMIAKGLSMTNTKIVSNADNQDITWDEHGLLCREYDDIISDYTDSQLKIINHGIYITDDNWKTARAGIGNFIYYDPKDKTYKESYGVIADTLVSNLILTSEVGIYNEEKSIEMAKDGIIVTTNTMNKNIFTIRKEITDDEGNITYERQLYIDDNGNIRLAGNASIAWDSITGTENVVVKDTLNEFMATVKEQIDGKIDTFRQSDDPSVNWTDEEKKAHENDLWYDTTNNIVKMWNGSSWDDFTGDVPESVWNEINGKAQIFTDTPKTPYNKGDLWVDGSDILTCMISKTDKETYSKDDWQKKNSYTDNSALNEFKNNVGYTQINSEWVISPNIKGGHLMITQDGSQYSAEITPDGKLKATGAEITGAITATSGSFTGTVNANSGTFTNVDIQSGKIGGLTLASNSIKSSNGNFSVTSGGKLTATDAIITGNITATSGSFTGAITATSLTLGSGVKIDYSKIDNTPEIPDTTKFYRIGNSLSINPTGATSSFAVDSDGLLTAHNAVIFGTIHATNGDIGGFNITTIANNNDHAYKNTLYRIINGSDGYDYQAGIKGDSDSNTTIEAAFYVRKKLRNENWGDSTIPFFVRNDGYVYCEDMTIGNSLYATGELSTKYDNLTSKFKIITAATDGVYFGLLDDTTKSRLACHTKGMLYELGVDRPFSIAKDGNLTYSIKKQGSINVDLGASGVNNRYRNLYIEKIIFPDNSSMTTAKTSGDASSYGSLTNKPSINGHTLASGNNTLTDLGIAAKSHSHSNSDINWSTTLGYKGFGHNHTMIYDGQGLKGISVAGSESPSNMGLIPYNVTYTNADSISLTRGGTMYLGAAYYSNKLTAYPFECGYFKDIKVYKGSGSTSDISNYVTPSGGGSISLQIDGTTRSSGFTNYNLATQDWVTGKGYLTQHQSLYGYATTSWVSNNFAPKGSGGGTTYYGGTGITISGNTISVDSTASSTHTHDHLTGSFDVTVGSSTMFPDGDGVYSCGSSGHRWKYVYASNGINTGSDEYIKENIKSITTLSSIDKFYMSLNPIQYKFKQRPNDDEISKIHFGFGARETERHLKENNFESENYSIVTKSNLDKPNFVGRTDEYSMNYLEFISLNTHMTQKAHHRIDSLTEENQKLKNTILSLQGEIAIIKQKLEELT